ncbi:HAD family hydrolase [Clostridium sp. D53t1_180928_C8]|uniref:HAD family hydrolase n=1 Tax=Clostridium sp. D53t1_180928_C8 TaxID=2787101 RepID=UPI0018A94F80|nr:HAD family hydrolase [Clostridium sp. D53t1_180928_C8]
MKKYILFDLDGTLTDPKVGITKSVDYALNKFNIKVDNLDELCKFIGPPLKDAFMEYYNFTEVQSEEAIKYYRDYFSERGIYENFVYEGLENMLKLLNDNNKICIVATSKPTVFAVKILEHFNLNKYFSFICGSNIDGTRSKKKEVIQHVIERNKIKDLSQVIMVGDRKHDVYGAKEIGLQSVGVLYGYGDYDELRNSGADYIVNNIKELSNLLIQM